MAFNDKEISTQDGRPVALYYMRWGSTEWAYTSADRDITYGVDLQGQPLVYKAKAMTDSGMTQGSSSQNDFEITAPSDLPIVALFRGTPPSETITLVIRRMHYGEPDAPIYWKGSITNLKRPRPAAVTIIGRPISASLKRTGLRLCWTRECPHFLYDVDCRVNPADFESTGEITAITPTSFTASIEDAEDHYYRGGYVSWIASAEGTVERRMIEDQVAGDITILGLTDGLLVGTEIKLYPGCDRLPTTCNNKFNNIDNYGGFDKMPGDTPFGKAIW
jgi:uncharacterized phage protein (TIGR02218 family)